MKTKMEYTKGEWRIGSRTITEIYVQTDVKVIGVVKGRVGKSGTIAKVRTPFGTQADNMEAEANARLIVTAPKMHKALQEIYEDYGFAFIKDILAEVEGI